MKRTLFQTRAGVCRVQVYLPARIARELVAIAELQNQSVSSIAARIIEDELIDYAIGARGVPAPTGRTRQRKLA